MKTASLVILMMLLMFVSGCEDAGEGELCGSCYSWQHCSAAHCATDGGSLWSVTAKGGNVYVAMDPFSDPADPYLCAYSYGTGSCSSTKPNTSSPSWGGELLVSAVTADALKAGIQVEIVDEDVAIPDVVCAETVHVTDSDLKNGEFTISCGNGDATFGLEHQ